MTYPKKMSFRLPSLILDDHQRPPNTLMIYGQELRKNFHLRASKLNEMHQDRLHLMYRAPPEEGPKDTKSTCCLQNYPDSTYVLYYSNSILQSYDYLVIGLWLREEGG